MLFIYFIFFPNSSMNFFLIILSSVVKKIQFFVSYFHYGKNDFKSIKKNTIYLDKYETHIFNNIKDKLDKYHCSGMWDNQREFFKWCNKKI